MSTSATEFDSAEPILNAALLSVMGRLKVRRACVLRVEGRTLTTVLTKGVAPIVVPAFDLDEPALAVDLPEAAALAEAGLTWLIPLHHQGAVTAMVCLGPTLENVEHDPDVRTYVDLVRRILSIAVHNVETMASLRQTTVALERGSLLVRSLYEFARDFTEVKERDQILRLLSLRLMGQLMTSNFAIYLWGADRPTEFIANRRESHYLLDLFAEISEIRKPLRTVDLDDGDPRKESLARNNVGMVAPMVLQGEVVGALVVCRKLNAAEYTEDELQFLEAAAGIVITAMENERLAAERVRMERLRSEIEIAARIQKGLLPLQLPATAGLDVAASSESSLDIGGDYYDVIPLDETRTLVAIADVSGKGVPAALLMANVQAALNVLSHLRLPTTQVIEQINRLVYMNTESDVFVTMFIAVIDTQTGTIEYVNAGHNPPVLLRGDEVILLELGGVLTGVLPDPPPYRLGVGGVSSGDVIVLYTDGVTETFDEARNEFGVASLVDAVRERRSGTAEEIRSHIAERVRAFAATPDEPHDDTSIVCIKVL
jgi:sigma-B regulation protein RsbU (phosphoserine phosphatase)